MSNVNYNKHNENVNRSHKVVRYGKYTEEYDDQGGLTTNIIKSVDVGVFYRLYLELNNVIGSRRQGNNIVDISLSNAPIELLVYLMCKDDDFTIVFRNKDATLIKLGEELNKTPSSIYANLSKLRKAGYIIKDEDNLFILNKELRDLITNSRLLLNNDEPLKFDFLFKFCVTNKK